MNQLLTIPSKSKAGKVNLIYGIAVSIVIVGFYCYPTLYNKGANNPPPDNSSHVNVLNKAQDTLAAVNNPNFISKEQSAPNSATSYSSPDEELPALASGMVNVTDNGKGYHIKFHKKELTDIVIKYSESRLPAGYNVSDIYTFRFDRETNKWMQLNREGIDFGSNEIHSVTPQDGDFINAIIKAPEAPEAQGYAPTTMSDIKVGDPASMVQVIKSPTVNNQGSANLTYHIEIPKGRQGMQADLGIIYNSDGGSNLLGEGWSLSGVSTISVDTRWGVPRYRPDIETETYLMDGKMLAMGNQTQNDVPTEAHRTLNLPRLNDRQFYERKESRFERIIRKESNPQNYYWVITEKETGNTIYYGASKDIAGNISFNPGSVLNNPATGDIAEWKISRIEDPFGNYVQFNYKKVTTDLNGNKISSIYLESVSYTRNKNIAANDWFNNVVFDYKDNIEPASINFGCRYGFPSSANSMLLNTVVANIVQDASGNGFSEIHPVRKYKFDYIKGEFGKILLDSITQFGYNNNNEIVFKGAGHKFSYYNLNSLGSPFSSPVSISVPHENPLGSSSTIPKIGFGASAGGGLMDGNLASKSMTIDGQFSYKQNATEGITAFADIDGNGMPDVVIKNGNQLSYFPNSSTDGKLSFGAEKTITGISGFSKDEGSSSSGGWQANGPSGISSFFGQDNSNSDNNSSIYFADANGDGVTDVIDNGRALFNLSKNSAQPINFSPSSSGTLNPIIKNGSIDAKFQLYPAEVKRIRDENIATSPLIDVVKIWVAPDSGTVEISAPVRLIQPKIDATNFDDSVRYKKSDGVIVSAQIGNAILFSQLQIPYNDYTEKFSAPVTKTVNKGDKITFRVQSGNTPQSNGDFDKVKWNPVIRYVLKDKVKNVVDVFGDDQFEFNSKNDFLISNGTVNLPDSGSYSIVSKFKKLQTADSIFLVIRKIVKEISGNLPDTSILVHRTNEFGGDTTIIIRNRHSYKEIETILDSEKFDTGLSEKQINITASKYSNDSKLLFEIRGASNINLKAITWVPELRINHIDNTHAQGTLLKDTLKCYPAYIFKGRLFAAGRTIQVKDSGNVTIIPQIKFKPDEKADVLFIVSDTTGVIRKKILSNQVGKNDSIQIARNKGQLFWVSYEINDIRQIDTSMATGAIPSMMASFPDYEHWKAPSGGNYTFYAINDGELRRSKYKINNGNLSNPIASDTLANIQLHEGDEIAIIDTTTATGKPVQYNVLINNCAAIWTNWNDADYGKMYRGWGQFAYNSMNVLNRPIDISKMHASTVQQTDITKIEFFSMVHNRDSLFYQGPNLRQYAMFDTIQVSRLAKADVEPLDIFNLTTTVNGAGAIGVIKSSKSNSSCTSGGVIISTSSATGKSTLLSDYLDMNGDRYPDILGQNYIQYTDMQGGLATTVDYSNKGGTGLQQSDISSYGYNLGGLFNHAFSTIARSKSGESDKNSSGGSSIAQTLIGLFPLSGAGKNGDDDNVTSSLYDINGDGLPDKIVGKSVYINLGYSFSPSAIPLAFAKIRSNSSVANCLGGGISFDNNSFSAGYNLSNTETSQEYSMLDMNGDGLTDEVVRSNSGLTIRFNTGNGLSAPYPINGVNQISLNKSDSKGLGGSYTVGFSPFIIPIKIVFSASANSSIGGSKTLKQFIDFDGDGFPDYVEYDEHGNISVMISKLGKVNKLNVVSRPLNGSLTLDYKHNNATFDHPGGKWVLASVVKDDGVNDDGLNARSTYDYQDGYYDRYEREFLGFEQITENQFNGDTIYRRMVKQFANSNYYTSNNETKEWVQDSEGRKYNETQKSYLTYVRTRAGSYKREKVTSLPPIYNGIVQNPLYTLSDIAYEGNNSAPLILNETVFRDDTLGNVISYKYSDKGRPISDNEYDYEVTTTFDNSDFNHYILGLPKKFEIKDKDGNLLRKQEADYYPWEEVVDGQTKKFRHKLKSQTVYLNNVDKAVSTFEYDKQYGNLIQKTFPNNFIIKYKYEQTLFTYLEKIEDSYNLSNEFYYGDERLLDGLKFGIPLTKKLSNNHLIKYKLDEFGRIDTIVGVNETVNDLTSNHYTLTFEYHPEALTAYAITKHFDRQNLKDGIYTISFIDGESKGVQVKKTGIVDGIPKWIISGRQKYDQLGRVVEAFYPVTENYSIQNGVVAGDARLINLMFDNGAGSTKTSYDVLDRSLTVALPDQASGNKLYATSKYAIAQDGFGKLAQVAMTSYTNDVKTNRKDVFTNGSGLTSTEISYLDKDATKPVLTKYHYNPLHQVDTVYNNRDIAVVINGYDIAGRRVSNTNNSGGTVRYSYDLAGNIIKKTNGRGNDIAYVYSFNRLISVHYSEHPQDSVHYTFGNRDGAGQNGLGRIVYIEDGTGSQSLSYDEMGNVTNNIRTVIAPFDSTYTFTTQYKYDSWGRLLQMIYPGGEFVNYKYNIAGLLIAVNGFKKGSDENQNPDFPYVSAIKYDKFEQRSSITYGNNVTTTYKYEPDRRRLNEVRSLTPDSRPIMTSSYVYDDINNVTSAQNISAANNSIMGVNMSHTYRYNNLNQLIYAKGVWNTGTTYELNLNFDDLYNIDSRSLSLSSATIKRNIRSNYVYNSLHTNQIDNIQESIDRNNLKESSTDYYSYDEDGNNYVNNVADSFQQHVNERKILWDEENRIRAISVNGYVSSYTYDANGERTVKISAAGMGIFVNGKFAGDTISATSFSLYVNPYYSMRNGNFIGTKHIYIGKERIASQLTDASQWINNDGDETTNPLRKTVKFPYEQNDKGYAVNFQQKLGNAERAINGFYEYFDLPHQLITHGGFRKEPKLHYTLASNPSDPNDIGVVDNTIAKDELLRFFYHSNYLGSTSFVTDKDAKVVQYVEYMPFGETFMEQRQNYSSQYLFNGKEQDKETGLYYYGARYYDPHAYQWLSIDPMADKYPGVSPYNFNLGNPVRMLDTDGNSPEWTNDDAYNYLKDKMFGTNEVKIFERKAEFINYYRDNITEAALKNNIDPVLLAGVGFTEYGGKPYDLKMSVLIMREYVNSMAPFPSIYGTLGRNPEWTSFGDFGIQIRRACEVMDCSGMSNYQIAEYLKDPINSINIAAKYLHSMSGDINSCSEENIKNIANQYNNGPGKQGDGSYGRSIFKHIGEINKALSKPPLTVDPIP